jgi:hypothetical protein
MTNNSINKLSYMRFLLMRKAPYKLKIGVVYC